MIIQPVLPKGFSEEHKNRLVFRCSQQYCFYAVSVKERIIPQHNCPQINGRTKVSWMSYGPSLLEQTWAELDQVTARLMTSPNNRLVDDRGYAQGLAFTLSLFMVPHFTSPTDISREAKKRYQMKQTGEEYCTPGLVERKYEPPPGDHKLSRISEEKAKAMRPKSQPKLTQAEIDSIKNAAGMFSSEELAKVYKITVAVVNQVLASQKGG